ncbi:MAG: hypothetical protein A4E35_01837 [Methanoregula sp. PtaU1.Bin051]|nr:MAG: hypothetical protein A4E35_01837 [Methanoregula sp. PtaU1.Bin051]
MRTIAVVFGMILFISIVAHGMAASEERYGYITVQDVTINLQNDSAIIDVEYSVDEGTRIIFFLLGKQDLKNKLYHILNYPEAQARKINLNAAEFYVENAAYSYGKGIYWYPSHEFNVVIPSLTIRSPQVTRTFSMTSSFPDGIGYFDDGSTGRSPLSPPSDSG